MKRIHDNNRLYNFLVPYVRESFRWSYRKVEYRGLENIPKEGAIIYAPNHANTLMDALAVLSIDDKPKVFVSRADIFKNKTVSEILHFLKMLPIHRIRDGVESLSQNEAIMQQCIEVLTDGVPFCILPEGRHRPMHSLLPLKKGIARIAFGAWERVKDTMDVYIVPVGLEYEDYFEFRSRLLITAGKPIKLQDFVSSFPEGTSEPELYHKLLLELASRMKETIVYLPDDERYKDVWDATLYIYGSRKSGSLQERREELQKIADSLEWDGKNVLDSNGHKVHVKRHPKNGMHLFWRVLFLLIFSPLAGLASLSIAPALTAIAFIGPKLKDRTFINAIRYCACYLLNPIILLVAGLIAVFFVRPWWIVPLIWAFSLAAPAFFFDWVNGVRQWVDDMILWKAARRK